jgi:hypothetical protein
MIVIVTFDCDLLDHFDAKSWNEFMRKLVQRGMTPLTWAHGKRPAPVGVSFDFRGLGCARRLLAGIDLTFCDLGEADFSCTNLQNAKLGSCPKASFKHAWLEGACFRGNISGCCFDGSVGYADFSNAYYSADQPPTGLPPGSLATCEILDPSDDDHEEQPPIPAETILNSRVSITEVPW